MSETHGRAQRIAIIDLGSNTARLIIMEATPGYAYRLQDEIREVVRLRQGMTARGLSEDAMQRAFFALRLFKRFCDSQEVDALIPTATSAVREAANGRYFVERVERELGITLEILDGEKEAYYAALGALNEVPFAGGYVLDIGGGSAQISQVEERRFRRGRSLPLGALTLTEKFVEEDPPSAETCAAIDGEIARQLEQVPWFGPETGGRLVGLERLLRRAAILRLAEFMERGRNGVVDDVAVTWHNDHLTLTLIADEYPAVELWETERNALELIEDAFGRQVTLESATAPDGSL